MQTPTAPHTATPTHKLCIDCRHHLPATPYSNGVARCRHPKAKDVDLVTGQDLHPPCHLMRAAPVIDARRRPLAPHGWLCGTEAAGFAAALQADQGTASIADQWRTACSELLDAAKRLQQRGHFEPSSCADAATRADLAAMRAATVWADQLAKQGANT